MPFVHNFASISLAVNWIVLGRSCIVVVVNRTACELPAEGVNIDRIFICQSIDFVSLSLECIQVGSAINSVDWIIVSVFVLDVIEKRVASACWQI
jgi:hypothetical protein